MTGLALFGFIALGLGVGILIGGVGIGGVLLVPCMAYFFGMPVHGAIAVAMFAYIFAGTMGAVVYARHGSIKWKTAGWLVLGAAPAAFVGAAAVSVTPGIWLEFLIALLIVFAGVNALRQSKASRAEKEPRFHPLALVCLGAVTGLGSAMTGTGGPLLLVPISVWLGFPALTAVGLSQAIQFPIASLATIGNLTYGELDWQVALVLAAALMTGAALGARLAHRVPRQLLSTFLSFVLVAVGLFLIVRLVGTRLI